MQPNSVATPSNPQTPAPAGLLLTLAAALYDALLVLAILFVASTVAVAINGGEAIAPGAIAFKIYLLASAFPYFAWCWMRSGQTLGMKTWRLRLHRHDGNPLRLSDAALRYATALLSWGVFMLGFAWMLVDARKRSWHDMASRTQVMRIPPSKPGS